MVRTQIYLTERQRDELAALAKTSQKNRASSFGRPSIDLSIRRTEANGKKSWKKPPVSGETAKIFPISGQYALNGTGADHGLVHPSGYGCTS